MSKIHVAIVGAGIVGLSVAYYLSQEGAHITIIDRDPDGDKASLGNAGGIAVTDVVPISAPGTLWRVWGWMVDPLGPLAVRPAHAPKLVPWLVRFAKVGTAGEVERISQALSALNARVYEDLLPMLGHLRLTGDLHRAGALNVYETDAGYRRDAAEWARKRALGIQVQELTGAQAREMEPALGSLVRHAVLTPQWSHISDPKRLVDKLREALLNRGVAIRKGEVRQISPSTSSTLSVGYSGGEVAADHAVVAAGAWSGILARRLGDRVLLESERGYTMTLPRPGIALERQLIFAERKFVATPLACGLRVGGAAEFGGLQAAPNFKRSQALVELARRYLPQLRIEDGISWAGHRPTTPDSLPVIGRSNHHANVFYAFGHGHLGLTQAATTGRLISELVLRKPASIDLAPYGIGRFS